MNVGTIVLCIFATLLGYQAWNNYVAPVSPLRIETPGFLTSQQVGRTRQIQSMHGDASMATEAHRRRAIAGQRYCGGTLNLPKKAIRETRTSTGQTTGYLEAYMISTMCTMAPKVPIVVPPAESPFIEFDGGNANTENVDLVFDGNENGPYYDGGNAGTHRPNEHDGGNADTDVFSSYFEGGDAFTSLYNYFFDGGGA
jgi:hypothetical protein